MIPDGSGLVALPCGKPRASGDDPEYRAFAARYRM